MRRETKIIREFNVPRKQLWRAWTDPDLFKKWWGPKGFTCPEANMDVREGGKYLTVMRSSDGKDFWSTGIFKEVREPEKLVLTDSFADEKGNVVPAVYYGMGEGFPLESTFTITFEEEDGKTKMSLFSPEAPGVSEKDFNDALQGWNESFDKLEEFLGKEG